MTCLALIEREIAADGSPVYGITFPDFPGCVSVGDTAVEALRNGHEALAGHVHAMRTDGDAVPPPFRDRGARPRRTRGDGGVGARRLRCHRPIPQRVVP